MDFTPATKFNDETFENYKELYEASQQLNNTIQAKAFLSQVNGNEFVAPETQQFIDPDDVNSETEADYQLDEEDIKYYLANNEVRLTPEEVYQLDGGYLDGEIPVLVIDQDGDQDVWYGYEQQISDSELEELQHYEDEDFVAEHGEPDLADEYERVQQTEQTWVAINAKNDWFLSDDGIYRPDITKAQTFESAQDAAVGLGHKGQKPVDKIVAQVGDDNELLPEAYKLVGKYSIEKAEPIEYTPLKAQDDVDVSLPEVQDGADAFLAVNLKNNGFMTEKGGFTNDLDKARKYASVEDVSSAFQAKNQKAKQKGAVAVVNGVVQPEVFEFSNKYETITAHKFDVPESSTPKKEPESIPDTSVKVTAEDDGVAIANSKNGMVQTAKGGFTSDLKKAQYFASKKDAVTYLQANNIKPKGKLLVDYTNGALSDTATELKDFDLGNAKEIDFTSAVAPSHKIQSGKEAQDYAASVKVDDHALDPFAFQEKDFDQSQFEGNYKHTSKPELETIVKEIDEGMEAELPKKVDAVVNSTDIDPGFDAFTVDENSFDNLGNDDALKKEIDKQNGLQK